MMLRLKCLALALAASLCLLCVFPSALAEGPVSQVWDSGCSLLFETDNVTVDGEARFSLDGTRFKTALLHYVQDGYRSFFGWKLLTPQADGSELETGWTIIADEEGYYYLMEAFEPGTYKVGSDNCQNTLLRRSVELDAMVDLGTIVAHGLTLPESAVSVTEQDGEKTVRLTLEAEQLSPLAASALNLGAGFLSDRWFGYGYDRGRYEDDSISIDSYITVTEALTDGTVRWTLRDMDVSFTLDASDRLIGARGTLGMLSVFWDGSIRGVDVELNLSVTGYGESHVKTFDPAEYGVVRTSDYDVADGD